MEDGCSGNIDRKKPIALLIGCASRFSCFPCIICGRLHWIDGKPVLNRQQEKFFLENGEIVYRDSRGQVIDWPPKNKPV